MFQESLVEREPGGGSKSFRAPPTPKFLESENLVFQSRSARCEPASAGSSGREGAEKPCRITTGAPGAQDRRGGGEPVLVFCLGWGRPLSHTEALA